MQKVAGVLVLLVLCMAHVGYGFAGEAQGMGRELLGRKGRRFPKRFVTGGGSSGRSASSSSSSTATSNGPSGSASSNAQATSTEGLSTADSEATSETSEKVTNAVQHYCETVFNDITYPVYNGNGYCLAVWSDLDEHILALGRVMADAYADAFAEVSVEGQGTACADAGAIAKSSTSGFAKIFADAVVAATNGDVKAEAKIIVEQTISVMASAFAVAHTSACAADRSSAYAVQQSYAKAVIYPIASLTIWLAAGVECHTAFAEAVVEAVTTFYDDLKTSTFSETGVEGTGGSSASGGASAKTASRCAGKYRSCCRRKWYHIQEGVYPDCTCFTPWHGDQCDAKYNYDDDYFVDEIDGSACHCH